MCLLVIANKLMPVCNVFHVLMQSDLCIRNSSQAQTNPQCLNIRFNLIALVNDIYIYYLKKKTKKS